MSPTNIFENDNYDEIFKIIESFEYDELGLRQFFLEQYDDHGLFILSLIIDIAYRKNITFWFENVAFFYYFHYHYIDGAQRSALHHLVKAHKLNQDSINILEAILDFRLPPEVVLTEEEVTHYAKKLLILDTTNKKALDVIHNVR